MKTTRTTDNHPPKLCFVLSKLSLLALIGCLFWVNIRAAQLGTAFTYSGRLKYQGNPANGNFDLQIKLYDAANAGNLVGTCSINSLAIVNGLFVTSVDFGSVSMFDGTAYWLEISARPSGNGAYQTISPRQPVNPLPYSFFSINASKIASGQVVKSLNGLVDDVTLQAGANVTLTPNGNGLSIAASAGLPGWSLSGNSGTSGANFLGTIDNQPLELRVNNFRALRLEKGNRSTLFGLQNTIANDDINSVLNGALGATIAGGGAGTSSPGGVPNNVGADFGTICGGANNTVLGTYGTVPGGIGNSANGEGSFAAGELSHANFDGSFCWGDGTQNANSTGPHKFEVLATGGAIFYTGGANTRADSPFLTIKGAGGEESYIGGDGNGYDVQVGSFNPAVTNVSLYNATINQWMNLFASDTTVRTLTITGGSDLAEPFELAEENIPAGSVVIIDDNHPGQLVRSSQPYDTRVAGVVSGANGIHPGLMLHQDGINGAGKNIALTGRVYVLADAATGPIKPGDLLTTSPTPGRAMRVADHSRAQGAVLGKAMTSLTQGEGMVLVLVTLQ
jgi:hypothetical protein